MCVISVLPKGKEKNGKVVEDFITSGFHSNTQGSGFMWKKANSNRIGISKGYFNLEQLLKSYKKMKFTIDDEVVVHHRIGTSGNKDGANTHPFYLHEDISICTKTEGLENLIAVCHNGVFSHSKIGKYMTTGYSDTVAFANKYMTQPGLIELLIHNPDTFESVTDDFVDSDKLCFLFPDKDLLMIGNYIEDDGYYHSNSGYKRYTRNVGGVEYPTYGYGYDVYNNYRNNYKQYSIYDDEYKPWHESTKDIVTDKCTTKKCAKYEVELDEIDELFEESFDGLDYKSYNLDKDYVNINKYNYKNFWVTPKKTAKVSGHENGDLFEITDYESDGTSINTSSLTILKSKDNPNKCYGYKLSFIQDNFMFIPKKVFANVYRDFLYLYFAYTKISNKKLKSIHTKLSDASSKPELSILTIDGLSMYKLAWLELYNQNCHKLSDLYTMIPQETDGSGDDVDKTLDKVLDKFLDNKCYRG